MGMKQMLGMTFEEENEADDHNGSNKSISKVDLSINNYDKSIHDITKSQTRAPTWK